LATALLNKAYRVTAGNREHHPKLSYRITQRTILYESNTLILPPLIPQQCRAPVWQRSSRTSNLRCSVSQASIICQEKFAQSIRQRPTGLGLNENIPEEISFV
jgi:hypothetical protein